MAPRTMRQLVRQLPNGAAACGWCDEMEARAKAAERQLAEVQRAVRTLRTVAGAGKRDWFTEWVEALVNDLDALSAVPTGEDK